jgi:NUMOD3 motif
MSAAKKGKTLSPETKAKIIAGRKGYSHSAETRAKISVAHKKRARKHSPDQMLFEFDD